jgi:hypothetical protein
MSFESEVVQAIKLLSKNVIGQEFYSIVGNLRAFCKSLVDDPHLRWVSKALLLYLKAINRSKRGEPRSVNLKNSYLVQQLGSEKGVVHLAASAIINAIWDLWGRLENKPVWKILVDLEPEQLVSLLDFSYL